MQDWDSGRTLPRTPNLFDREGAEDQDHSTAGSVIMSPAALSEKVKGQNKAYYSPVQAR